MEEYNTQKSTPLSSLRWKNTVSTAWTQEEKINLKMYFYKKINKGMN